MSSSCPALLVAGTDTGVGKTVATVLLISALRRRGLRVLAMKPAESGCDGGAADAAALAAVSGDDEPAQGPGDHDLCPYRLSLPVAPESAAAAEGRTIELGVLEAALARLRADADLVVVESAGGLGSPYGPGLLVLDLARALGLPVLLVAADRLGTVGQMVVALRLMAHEAVRCVGVVLSRVDAAPPGPDAPTNAPLVRAHGGGVPLVARLPHLPDMPPARDLRDWAARRAASLERQGQLDAELLLGALGLRTAGGAGKERAPTP